MARRLLLISCLLAVVVCDPGASTWRTTTRSLRPSPGSFNAGKYKRLHHLIDAASPKCFADAGRERDALRAFFDSPTVRDIDRNVTVIIGSYARPEMLRHILRALSEQELVCLTTIVADAGSLRVPSIVGDTPDILLRYKDDGKYHRVRSFNDGAQLARTSHIIFLDDDTIPLTPFWAATHVRRLIQEPRAFTRGPVHILMSDADVSVTEATLQEVRSIDWPHAELGWFSTTNLGFRRSTWDAVGGLDSAFDGNYGFEDKDLGRTVEAAGLQSAILPALSCALHPSVHFAQRVIPRPKDRSINKKLFKAKWDRKQRFPPADRGHTNASVTTLVHYRGAGDAAPAPASVVIAVTSVASNRHRREKLRKLHHMSLDRLRQQDPGAADTAVLRFVLGNDLDDAILEAVIAENSTHGDLLLMPVPDCDRPDPPPSSNDSATTLKVAHAARWAVDSYKAPWFVRMGDDAYFRVDYFLARAAKALPTSHTMLGWCINLQHGLQSGEPPVKGAVVPYCSGMGFVLTYDAAAFVASNLGSLSMAYPEDVVVASWFVGTNIQIKHDERFTDWVWKRCSNQSIVIHKMGDAEVNQEDGTVPTCFP